METKLRISNKGFDNENISFIIGDYHEEYPLPRMRGATIRKEYDGHHISEFIEDIVDMVIQEPEELLQKGFQKRLETLRNPENANGFNVAKNYTQMEDEYTTLWHLTIWKKENIEKYFEIFKADIIKAIENVNGDDDIFDYMPNYVDMFMQFCDLIGKKEEGNKVYKKMDRILDKYK